MGNIKKSASASTLPNETGEQMTKRKMNGEANLFLFLIFSEKRRGPALAWGRDQTRRKSENKKTHRSATIDGRLRSVVNAEEEEEEEGHQIGTLFRLRGTTNILCLLAPISSFPLC